MIKNIFKKIKIFIEKINNTKTQTFTKKLLRKPKDLSFG